MNRNQKTAYVEQLNGDLKSAECVVVAYYTGLTVVEMESLRKEVREAGAKFKVTKNTLTRLALDNTKFAPIIDMFTGPTAVAYSEDPVAAAKAVVNFTKGNDKLEILGGALGEEQLDVNAIKALASLPSLDELRAKIVGMISTPATRLAGITQAPAGQIARVINAYAQQQG